MYIQQLTDFFVAINKDERIGTSHISLYMALFEFWNRNHFENPIAFTRKNLMDVSKISAISTYHKVIKDLHDLGYIIYVPSFHPANGSKAYLLSLEKHF